MKATTSFQQKTLFNDLKSKHEGFDAYPNPSCPYHEFINKFCHHPDNLNSIFSKDKIIKNANESWQKIKNNPKELRDYLDRIHIQVDSLPNKPESSSSSWFQFISASKAAPLDTIPQIPVQTQTNLERSDRKRKAGAVDPNNDYQVKKSKSFALIEYAMILDFLFECNDNVDDQFYREEIEVRLRKEEESNKHLYILLTDFIQEYREYLKFTSFKKSHSEFASLLSEIRDEAANFLQQYLGLIDLTHKLNEGYSKKSQNIMNLVLNNLHIDNHNLKSLENEITNKKCQIIMKIGCLSTKLAFFWPKLKSNTENKRSYSRKSFASPIVKGTLKIECLNPFLDWGFVFKVINKASNDEDLFLPFVLDDLKHVMKLFKDEHLVVLKYEILFQMIFDHNGTVLHHNTVKSNKTTFKNLLLTHTPLLFFIFNNETYVLDTSKFLDYPDEILYTFSLLMDEKLDLNDKPFVAQTSDDGSCKENPINNPQVEHENNQRLVRENLVPIIAVQNRETEEAKQLENKWNKSEFGKLILKNLQI